MVEIEATTQQLEPEETPEQIAARNEAITRGDLIEVEGFDGEGNEIKAYELTEQGKLRTLNAYLFQSLQTALALHEREVAKWKIKTYLEQVVQNLAQQAEQEVPSDATTPEASESDEPGTDTEAAEEAGAGVGTTTGRFAPAE